MADRPETTDDDALQDELDREQQLLDERGMTITFQVYRIDLRATTLEDLQGKRLAELTVDGAFVSGAETVADVREKLLAMLREKSCTDQDTSRIPELKIEESDRITLFFGGHPMEDDGLFYADHFMMLPAWVQVCLHDCDREDLLSAIAGMARRNDRTP